MSDESVASVSSVSSVQGDGIISVVSTAAMLLLSAAALRGAFCAAFDPCRATLTACRRWAVACAVAVVAYLVVPWSPPVDPEVPILVAIAVVDCWLVLNNRPRSALPRAIARRRSPIA